MQVIHNCVTAIANFAETSSTSMKHTLHLSTTHPNILEAIHTETPPISCHITSFYTTTNNPIQNALNHVISITATSDSSP